MWHLEVESLLVLKITAAVEGNRDASYGLRGTNQQTHVYPLLKGEDITLFSPSDVPAVRRVLRQ
ncbi:hypothetical protein ACNKHV_14205 [Shigella flexneri]